MRWIHVKTTSMDAAPGDGTCPVASLDLYLIKLHPECDDFSQQSLGYSTVKIGYAKQLVCKNELMNMLFRISTAEKLPNRYTNRCIRATVDVNLKRAGVDISSIMYFSGHSNVKSLESYIHEPSDKEMSQLSASLQIIEIGYCGQLSEEHPIH